MLRFFLRIQISWWTRRRGTPSSQKSSPPFSGASKVTDLADMRTLMLPLRRLQSTTLFVLLSLECVGVVKNLVLLVFVESWMLWFLSAFLQEFRNWETAWAMEAVYILALEIRLLAEKVCHFTRRGIWSFLICSSGINSKVDFTYQCCLHFKGW